MRLLLATTLLCFIAVPAAYPQAHEAPAQQAPAAPTPAPTPAPVVPAAPAPQPAAHGSGHGPVVHLFGGSGPALSPLGQWLVKLFNFAIFAGALFFALKGVLSSAFKARARELEALLGQAERDRSEGEAQIRALETKMAGLQAELDGILGKAAEEAEAERARIVATARTEAEAILAQARFEIETHHRHAEQELRALVADLAVEGARARLQARLVGAEAQRAMDAAISQVGGAK